MTVLTEEEVELHLYNETIKRKKEGKTPEQIASYCRGFRKVEKIKSYYPETNGGAKV